MDCKDTLKIVSGNGFTLRLQIEARRTDGSLVEDFALEGDEVLKLLHNGEKETHTYERVGNDVYVAFDGDDDLGWYGLEMTGLFHDEPWRWSVTKVFQIVETNERAHIPSWTILADDTYIIGCGITLLSAVIHADWAETDTSAPSYIKNKPDLTEYATNIDLIATNQRVTTLEATAVKTVVQSFSDLQKNTARNNISAASVAQVNAKQDAIADLSTIRSGAADGSVARGYLNDFSAATHTPPEQVGAVLATVASIANGAQPRLTAGANITITDDNVISASGGGGSADAVLYTPQTLTPAQQTQARSNISAYTKPSGGIPLTDMAAAVQTSLGKADTALQSVTAQDVTGALGFTPASQSEVSAKYTKPTGGIPKTDMASAVQTSLGKADTALQSVTAQDVTGALGFTPENADNKVTSVSSSSTNTQYPTAKCVYDLGAVKQNMFEIVAASGTTLTGEANKYYRFGSAVDTLAVTLAHTSSTYVQTVVLSFTVGTTPAVTFAPAVSGESIYYADGFSIEAGKTYEVNALWNGSTWMVALLNIVVS